MWCLKERNGWGCRTLGCTGMCGAGEAVRCDHSETLWEGSVPNHWHVKNHAASMSCCLHTSPHSCVGTIKPCLQHHSLLSFLLFPLFSSPLLVSPAPGPGTSESPLACCGSPGAPAPQRICPRSRCPQTTRCRRSRRTFPPPSRRAASQSPGKEEGRREQGPQWMQRERREQERREQERREQERREQGSEQ